MSDDNAGNPAGWGDLVGTKDPRDTYIQIILSVVLGAGAFLAFCILRPRWTSLYAARKQKRDQASPLPELPTSLFGWIPSLWRITEQQVLTSAGLDAYVVRETSSSMSRLSSNRDLVPTFLQDGHQVP